ncbi:DNA-binding transcriptional regulator, LysR family [Luteibacter sp. UNCMF331Sha3.1]|uniref:LysR family transcriptional regulator n=1 Tax=Luteibacter sp. UNCMF331Sha3.1 TaxID=1502760 RepID=UPI0008BF33A8|nr:LysR family transcriptional regulator [Luteibacter sp. UNCMF331Sha3.1]SEN10727.1 DNA-binding transcriptional regulator, LysR family [Luteibacter sp. UNCMF331Sha3.1]
MKDILTLRLYTRVARLGSFSAAAREAGLAQSQVSRMIADLEAGLGARLLSRTTRAVQPTEAGLEFLARMEPILAAIEDAENSVRETGELRGVLRIGMPSTMALRVVIPRLRAFAERHPQLHIELLLDDKWQDMVREAVDVGIRVGTLPDAAGTARLIGRMQRVVVASPDYIASHGKPERPEDIPRHRIVGGPAAMQATSWRFEREGGVAEVEIHADISSNDTAGALAAATGGLGLTSTTSWACRDEIRAGQLVALLPDWTMAQIPVHAYFPLGRATRLAARAFVDFICAQLEGHEDWRSGG